MFVDNGEEDNFDNEIAPIESKLALAGNDKNAPKVRSISLGPEVGTAPSSEETVSLPPPPASPKKETKVKVEIKGKEDKKDKVKEDKKHKEEKHKDKEEKHKDKEDKKEKDKEEKKDKKK